MAISYTSFGKAAFGPEINLDLEEIKESINDDCPINIQWDSENKIFIIDGVPVSPDLLIEFVHAGETEEQPSDEDDLPF
jgi:hypothetical protein